MRRTRRDMPRIALHKGLRGDSQYVPPRCALRDAVSEVDLREPLRCSRECILRALAQPEWYLRWRGQDDTESMRKAARRDEPLLAVGIPVLEGESTSRFVTERDALSAYLADNPACFIFALGG